jgi:hypothetical protein
VTDLNPIEPKSAELRPAEPKPAEFKSAESKSAESKPVESKPAARKRFLSLDTWAVVAAFVAAILIRVGILKSIPW